MTNITMIGCGNMGTALLAGLAADPAIAAITVVKPTTPSAALQKTGGHKTIFTRDAANAATADIVIIAVKPQVVGDIAGGLAARIKPGGLCLSVAAGISTAYLARHVPPGTSIIRTMPNTPCAIGRGITALYAARGAGAPHKKAAQDMFARLGDTVWLQDETQMDAVTALSGSGPAYVFLLTEVLARVGQGIGLPAETAEKLARSTVTGAAALLGARADTAPGDLRAAVTSPNGTTAAAMTILHDNNALENLFADALEKARKRAEELGMEASSKE